ncbi:hypothetical protein FB555_001853 [Alpinimonas psychrophila]|uniref:Uncharacterized protein n=1 Tax=Alpinimonas psychrophila TaxID=748908 RepID=A0A7W3JV54_9MICO|nr:hypothetical protein [Alpinimonas psychrophila]
MTSFMGVIIFLPLEIGGFGEEKWWNHFDGVPHSPQKRALF